jgi:hypothetical protein
MPAEAQAKIGDTIEWINKDVIAHTATARAWTTARSSASVLSFFGRVQNMNSSAPLTEVMVVRSSELIGLRRGAIFSLVSANDGIGSRANSQPPIDDVGRMIGGQPQRADVASDAELLVMLHRARALRASFRMPARRFLGVEQHTAYAMPVEQQRQHQSDRPAADDGGGNLRRLGVGGPAHSTLPGLRMPLGSSVFFKLRISSSATGSL